MAMNTGELEEALRVVESCISRIKWRLRPSAKRRLETDILALCTGLRPVVMVDYGGKMPELQEHLCMLMQLAHKEPSVLLPLRVMVIEDMIYMIHIRGLAEHALPNQPSQEIPPCAHNHIQGPQPLFVDLEQDPPKILLNTEQNSVAEELVSIQKIFSSVIPIDEVNRRLLPLVHPSSVEANTNSSGYKTRDFSCGGEHAIVQSSDFIDLSSCLKDTHVTIPTLNGWLLGYPVVYLFGKDHISDAIYNLSTKSLHLYKIVVCRNKTSGKKSCEEELMSFSVPYDLSMGGREEPWAEAFLAHMMAKFERCKNAWAYLRLEVSECYPQAVVL